MPYIVNKSSNQHKFIFSENENPPILTYSLSNSPALIICGFQIRFYKNSPLLFTADKIILSSERADNTSVPCGNAIIRTLTCVLGIENHNIYFMPKENLRKKEFSHCLGIENCKMNVLPKKISKKRIISCFIWAKTNPNNFICPFQLNVRKTQPT